MIFYELNNCLQIENCVMLCKPHSKAYKKLAFLKSFGSMHFINYIHRLIATKADLTVLCY